MADENEKPQGGGNDGLSTETSDSRRDNPDADRSALESRVAQSLANFREIDSPADESEDAPEQAEVEETGEGAESPQATDIKAEQDGEEVDPSPENEEAEESEQPPKAKAKTGPILPDSYRRSLKAYGWDDEEIDRALKNDPASFTLTAQKIHTNRNAEVAQWAALGRASRPASQGEQTTQAQQSPHVTQDGKFKPIDVDALVEKHGNEDLVRELVGPVNAAIEQINSMLPVLQTGVQSINQSKVEQLNKQVDDFFGGQSMTTYQPLYGDASKGELTKEHLESRMKVLELADALVSGARQQGRNLSNQEAMLMAHDSVSSGFKVQSVRKEIQGKVTQRNKGLTLRPTQRQGKDAKAPPSSRSELENRTKDRLASVFGGR